MRNFLVDFILLYLFSWICGVLGFFYSIRLVFSSFLLFSAEFELKLRSGHDRVPITNYWIR